MRRCVTILALVLGFAASGAQGGVGPEFPAAQAWSGRGVISRGGRWERVDLLESRAGHSPQLVLCTSTDNGKTWSSPEMLTELPDGEPFGGIAAAAAPDGALQVFISRTRKVGEGKRPAVDLFVDIWHTHSSADRKNWSQPKRIFEGYIGALSNAIVLQSGRVMLPFGRWVADRPSAPPTGSNEVVVLSSEDNGETFKLSDPPLTSPCFENYNGSNYGACEPALVQLRDGRVLMLMRTQAGYLYESISADGVNWPPAQPSRFHSSTGPPALIRLPDDRIVLFWNNCEMPPRVEGKGVYGGRDALHAAIADPDLNAWRGMREVYLDPTRDLTPPKRGDRGTAYPDALLMSDGRVAISSGQGGRRAVIYVDPAWLEDTTRSEEFRSDLSNWCVYKPFGPAESWWRDRKVGAVLAENPDKPGAKVLHVRRPDSEPADGAVWNFPAATSGSMTIRIRANKQCQGGIISLNDRFFDPTNDQGEKLAIVSVPFTLDGHDDTWPLQPDQWNEFVIDWDFTAGRCELFLNGQDASRLTIRSNPSNGVSYLRLRSSATSVDKSGFYVESVHVQIHPPSHQ